MIDLEWLRRLISMVDEAEIDSLEVSRFGTRVKIAKSPPVAAAAPAPSPPGASYGAAGSAAAGEPAVSDEAGESEESAEERASTLVEISSPMVGTFYRAPAPDAPPYVETGDVVKQGQTLCILEAMKLMNELESEVSGTIREICVENTEPVEFGQVLFRIEPGEGG